jgi:membrane protease YdiL (CAAX protease family)
MAQRSLPIRSAAQVALAASGVVLLSNIADFGAALHGWDGLYATELLMAITAALATASLARHGAVGWLALPRRVSGRGFALTLLAMALTLAAAEALGLVLPMSDSLMLHEYRGDEYGLALALFTVAGTTPLLEEWFFRGILLECALAVFPAQAAVVVVALLFAMFHLSPATLVHHGLLGYVCGRVRLGSGSLWTAVACHALYNAVVVLATW